MKKNAWVRYTNWMKNHKSEYGNVIRENFNWKCQKVDFCRPKQNVDSYAWMIEQDENVLLDEWLGEKQAMTTRLLYTWLIFEMFPGLSHFKVASMFLGCTTFNVSFVLISFSSSIRQHAIGCPTNLTHKSWLCKPQMTLNFHFLFNNR